jgi:hypothetical protein
VNTATMADVKDQSDIVVAELGRDVHHQLLADTQSASHISCSSVENVFHSLLRDKPKGGRGQRVGHGGFHLQSQHTGG